MTREEFIKVMAYITAGINKALEASSLEVYFDLLGDLPYQTLAVAAKRVLLTHRWATFPTVAELREAAALTQTGTATALSPAEAWALAWRAVAGIDPEVDGSWERGTAKLPAIVVRAIQVFGLNGLCYGTEPLGVLRAQFMKVYEQLANRVAQEALMPPAVRQAIAAQAPRAVEGNAPSVVKQILGGAFQLPEGKK